MEMRNGVEGWLPLHLRGFHSSSGTPPNQEPPTNHPGGHGFFSTLSPV
jgi:hypothetical protein